MGETSSPITKKLTFQGAPKVHSRPVTFNSVYRKLNPAMAFSHGQNICLCWDLGRLDEGRGTTYVLNANLELLFLGEL